MGATVATAVDTEIRKTALDYFEGWFDGDVGRMRRALHPGLAKRALEEDGGLNETTAEWMIDATAAGRGKRAGVEIDVDVVDVYGNIANVVVRSSVYREYLQLVRTADGWKIVNALWQRT
jgi:hypothetical protein